MLKIDIENTAVPVNQDEPHVEAQENQTSTEPSAQNSQEEESINTENVSDEKPDKQDNNKYWAKLKKERAEKRSLLKVLNKNVRKTYNWKKCSIKL